MGAISVVNVGIDIGTIPIKQPSVALPAVPCSYDHIEHMGNS